MQKEMFNQKRADNHPYAVMHPAFLPKLTHTCINNWIASLTLLPTLKRLFVFVPWEGLKFFHEWLICYAFFKMVKQIVRKFAPANFRKICFDVLIWQRTCILAFSNFMPDLTWGNFTVM